MQTREDIRPGEGAVLAIEANKHKMTDESKQKTLFRPSQDEANYTELSATIGQACANCRWFYGGEFGPGCHLIENYPRDILATGLCNRWEAVPQEASEPPVMVVGDEAREASEVIDPDSTGEVTTTFEAQESTGYIAPDSNAPGLFDRVVGKFRSGLKPGTEVIKDADGKRYMLIVTSNSYQDRENETITTDALNHYVSRAWKGEDVFISDNPLLFWHDDRLKIGEIVWADVRGPFLAELAREVDNPVAHLIFDYREQGGGEAWGASHRFGYFTPDRDGQGTYRRIFKRETSILPRSVAANTLTFSGVLPMSDKRGEYLNKILGLDNAAALLDEGFDKLVAALEARGIQHKEQQPDSARMIEQVKGNFEHLLLAMVDAQADLDEKQAELVEANKALTVENQTLKSQTVEAVQSLIDRVADLEAQIKARPKRAAVAKETEIDENVLSAEARQALIDSIEERDPFFNARLKR